MDCRDVKRNIPSLLYEELSGELEQEIRNHIDSCPACSEVWEESRKARSYLDLWPDIDSRPDPAAIVKEASRRPARREPRFVRARRWLPLLAAASLLLFFLFALVEVVVNRANGDLVITIGRAAAEDGPMFPGSDGNIPDLVHDEVEAGIQDLFEVIGRQLDVVMQRQEKNPSGPRPADAARGGSPDHPRDDPACRGSFDRGDGEDPAVLQGACRHRLPRDTRASPEWSAAHEALITALFDVPIVNAIL